MSTIFNRFLKYTDFSVHPTCTNKFEQRMIDDIRAGASPESLAYHYALLSSKTKALFLTRRVSSTILVCIL